MQEIGLNLELPRKNANSVWPWVIAVVAFALLLSNIAKLTETIPLSLYKQAQETIVTKGVQGAFISVDGRDLVLSGEISDSVNRDELAETLNGIDGVRVVEDNMTVFSPADIERRTQAEFRTALANVDLNNVEFELGSTSLTESSKQTLSEVVQLLRAYPQYRIRVAGHTDNLGRPAVNLRISKQRAQAVANFLQQRNVGNGQVIAQGYGATSPIASNETENGRARNRRIEIKFID